jgi:hypothetical protein
MGMQKVRGEIKTLTAKMDFTVNEVRPILEKLKKK